MDSSNSLPPEVNRSLQKKWGRGGRRGKERREGEERRGERREEENHYYSSNTYLMSRDNTKKNYITARENIILFCKLIRILIKNVYFSEDGDCGFYLLTMTAPPSLPQ